MKPVRHNAVIPVKSFGYRADVNDLEAMMLSAVVMWITPGSQRSLKENKAYSEIVFSK